MKESRARANITEMLGLFEAMTRQPSTNNPYQFQVKNHILEYFQHEETFILSGNNINLIKKLFKDKQLQWNVRMYHKEFIKQEPKRHEWCSRGTINALTINMGTHWQHDRRFNIYLPKQPIQVNELTLDDTTAVQLPLVNMLLKMHVQPLKSLTINFDNKRAKITQENVDFLITIVQDLEKLLGLQNRLKICIQLNSSFFDTCSLDILNKLATNNKQIII